MTCSFQLCVVAAFLKNRETSLPHFTQAFILLLKTASGPSRYVPLCLSPAPPLLEPLPPHTPCSSSSSFTMLSLPWERCWGSTTAQYLFYLHLSDCCFYCSSSWAAVFCVFGWVCWCACSVCVCAHAQFHDSCGLVCILVLCVKGEKKRQSAILLYYRSLLGAKYGWGSPCFAWKSLGWTRVYVTKTMWKLWETSKIFSSSHWCPK